MIVRLETQSLDSCEIDTLKQVGSLIAEIENDPIVGHLQTDSWDWRVAKQAADEQLV